MFHGDSFLCRVYAVGLENLRCPVYGFRSMQCTIFPMEKKVTKGEISVMIESAGKGVSGKRMNSQETGIWRNRF
ncbi:hypothetical protein D7V83_14520 [bacterium 0.1xD8-71]|nr:hypothetical protein D7V83_14520 [bacterium 0.1xD8-71]